MSNDKPVADRREEFEAWCRDEMGWNPVRIKSDGGYSNMAHDIAWHGWRAALSSQQPVAATGEDEISCSYPGCDASEYCEAANHGEPNECGRGLPTARQLLDWQDQFLATKGREPSVRDMNEARSSILNRKPVAATGDDDLLEFAEYCFTTMTGDAPSNLIRLALIDYRAAQRTAQAEGGSNGVGSS